MTGSRKCRNDGAWRSGGAGPCPAFPGCAEVVALCLLAIFLGTAACPPSAAGADGRILVRHLDQEGRTSGTHYRQTTNHVEGQGNQLFSLGSLVRLGLDGRFLRELYKSKVDSVSSDLDRRSAAGGFSVDCSGRRGRLSLNGEQLEERNSGEGTDMPLLRRLELGSSGALRLGEIRFEGNGSLIEARQQHFSGPDTRNRELSGALGTRVPVFRFGQLGYRFSALTSRNLSTDARETQTSHNVLLNGAGRFAGGRGQASVRSNLTFFNQRSENVLSPAGPHVRPPLTGGVVLDDTPEQFDPLEGDLASDPGLYDGDRQTPTLLNLGDSAPAVRDIGGDYRNLVFDFGEPVEIASCFLFIDRTFPAAALFRFRVFTTNDPEGRIWTELDPAAFHVAYQEQGTGTQGWSVVLDPPVTARFFKLVDVKLGPTVTDLFVTELEVSTRQGATVDVSDSRTDTQRLAGSQGYALTRSIRAGYDLVYRRRVLSGVAGALDDASHGFTAGWTRGLTSLTARYELRSLERRNNRSVDNNSQTVSLRRGRSDRAVVDLSWARQADRGRDLQRTSNSWGLGVDWRAAPALRFAQRLSVGRLSGDQQGVTSNSVALISHIAGQPVPSLSLSLDEVDRWVSREAGTGFSRFGDTALSVTWLPVPLVSVQSQVRYERQRRGDWLTRNTVSWNPFAGGDVRPSLSATQYRDTRTGETQRGGSAQLDWRARPTLTFHAGMESLLATGGGQRNTPLNTELSGTWRF